MGLIEAGESYRRVHDLLRERAARPVPTHRAASSVVRAGQRQSLGDGHDIGALLRVRRSVREFSSAPVELRQLERVVRTAHAVCDDTWPASRHGTVPITVLAVARDVPGAEHGLLRVGTDGCDLISALDTQLAETLCRDYPDAPVLLLLCANPHALGDNGGYGSVLVRVGAAGYAIWLAALAEGLQACVHGRSSNEFTRIARQLDPCLRHLFTMTIGREESSDAANRS
jgi:hypothetical protein